jgi:hypothetical protein
MALIENPENYGFNFTEHNYDDLNYCGCTNWPQNPIRIRRFVINNNPLQNESLNSNAPIWSSSLNLMFLPDNQDVINGHLTQLNERMTLVGPDVRQAVRAANFPQLYFDGNPIYKYLIPVFMYIFTTGYFRQMPQYYPNGIFRLYLEHETFMNLHKLFTNIPVSFCGCFLNYIYHLQVKYSDALNPEVFYLFRHIIQVMMTLIQIQGEQISRIQHFIQLEQQVRHRGTEEEKRNFLLHFLITFNPHAHIYTYQVKNSPINQYNTNKWFSQFVRYMPIIQKPYPYNNNQQLIHPPLSVIIHDAHAHTPLHNYYLYLRQLPPRYNVILQGSLDYLNFQHHSRYGCWAGLSFFKKMQIAGQPLQINRSIITNEQWVNTFGRVLCRVAQDNKFIVCNSNTELTITRKLYPRSIEFKGSNQIGTWPVIIDTTFNRNSKIHTYGSGDELSLSYFLLDSRNKSKDELGHETYLDGMNVHISYTIPSMDAGDDLINSYIPNLTIVLNYSRLCLNLRNNNLGDNELENFYNANIRNMSMKTSVPNGNHPSAFDPDKLEYNPILQNKKIMLKNRTKLNVYDMTIYLSICKCIIIIILYNYKQYLIHNNSPVGLVSIPNVLKLFSLNQNATPGFKKIVFTILNTVWGYSGYNMHEGDIISIKCDLTHLNLAPAQVNHLNHLFNLMNYYITQFERTQYWFKSILETSIEKTMADNNRKMELYSTVDRLLMDDFYQPTMCNVNHDQPRRCE